MVSSIKKVKQACALHKIIKLRQRHIFTRHNTVRLRYLCGCGVSFALAMTLAMAHSGVSFGYGNPTISSSYETAATDTGAADLQQDQQVAVNAPLAQAVQSEISGGIRKASALIQKAPPTPPGVQQVQIGRGDTLAGALQEAGVSGDDAYQAVKALSEHIDPRMIRPGAVINVQFQPSHPDSTDMTFERMTMDAGPLKKITVRKENDHFSADLKEKEMKPHTWAGYAKIENSLYGSAERAGIPPQVLGDLIKLYSRNIDFQRDIQKGDKIEVLYDGQQTADGGYAKYGNIVYANLTVSGKSVPIYRFETKDGRVDYYSKDGRTTRKTLLSTPVDGARVSSGFGMRFHPILGYTRMHKGIDFAAPTGTPIYAAGDGTIIFEGRKNGYGNFVEIRHNSELETAYGHMSRFASDVHSGDRVKQGELIGYVGATGEATGPHLHYEVRVHETQVNPRSVDLPTGENLGGKELDRFRRTIGGITQQYVSLTGGVAVAQSDTGQSDTHLN